MATLSLAVSAPPVWPQIPPPPDGSEALSELYPGRAYSPYAGRGFPSRMFWGDTHLHTALSMDAGAFGNRLGFGEAYRLARGEEVTSSTGLKVKLARPLDFLVVADHSDNMGFFPDLFDAKPHVLKDPTGKDWYDRVMAGEGVGVALELIGVFSQGQFPEALMYTPDSAPYKSAWQATVDAAEGYNEPGRFTAFIGYEWTSLVRGNNMHRVVIYRDGGDKGGQMVPFTTVAPTGSINPRDLWKWLTMYEQTTGGDVLAIAQNGNLANGIMFPLMAQYDGVMLDDVYVTQRAMWEPLYEATQIKGDGEAHPFLSPDDEFADYETWDLGNLDASEAKTNDMLAGEYAREALKRGLAIEATLGTNPYKIGMIGSTDSHTSLSTAEEDNFFGTYTMTATGDPLDLNGMVGASEGFGPATVQLDADGAGADTKDVDASGGLNLAAGEFPSVDVFTGIDKALGKQVVAGAPYEATELSFVLDNNIIRLAPFRFTTEFARLDLDGTISLEGPIDLGLSVATPREGLNIDGATATVLDVLADDEGWVPIPMTITGTMDKRQCDPTQEHSWRRQVPAPSAK